MFASSPLEEGTVVIRVGWLVGTDELARLIDTSGHDVDTLTVLEDVHLVLPAATTVHYGNHSCDPTLWHVGPYDIATRRPVPAGEELTVDYATQTGAPGFSMPCRCGAAGCRDEVTSEDWRRADLQAALRRPLGPGAGGADRAAELTHGSRPSSARVSASLFTCGKGWSGTSTPSAAQIGSHPSPAVHSTSRPAGAVARTCSL